MSKISELSDGGVIQGGDTLIAVRSGGNVKVTYGGTTTANIDGGTIDNTTIGGTTPAAGNFTTGSFTGNVSFGDNDKAIFGAGSDLQIYHDGFSSYIEESGAGSLLIRGDNTYLTNTAGTKDYIHCVAGGEVILHYDNGNKLETTSTGIDVTGTVTADGLTVEGAGAKDIRVGSTDGSGAKILLDGSSNGDFLGGDYSIIQNLGTKLSIIGGTLNAPIELETHDGSSNKLRQKIASNGDISFYEDTGTTAKFFWDASAESLGIGTDNPAFSAGSGLRIERDSTATLRLQDTGAHGFEIRASASAAEFVTANSKPFTFGNLTDEHMRIDSSGNLLVGKTTSAIATEGVTLGPNGQHYFTSANDAAVKLNRLTTDGEVLQVRQDGTVIGAISTIGSDIVIGGSSGSGSALRFDGTNNIIYASNATGSARDAALDLGTSSVRFKDLYLSNAVRNSGGELKCIASTNIRNQGAVHTWSNAAGSTEYGRFNSSGDLLVGATTAYARLHVKEAANKSETDAHVAIEGLGYSAYHWLDANAYYIGQNSTIRAVRIYSGTETAGVALTNGSTSWGTFSDERLKYDIEPINNALQSLSELRTIKYRLKDVDEPDSQKKLGVVAQDLVGVLDEVVEPLQRNGDDTEYMAVRYTELVPVLIKAVQEQQDIIENLKSRIEQLEGEN